MTQQTIACLSKTKFHKEIETAATAAAIELSRKMSIQIKVSAGTDERAHKEVPAKPDNDLDIDSNTDKKR